jgi:hypothetical protein
MTAGAGTVLGRGLRVTGWLCAASIACVIIELVTVLPYMQQVWSTPPGQLSAPDLFDLRSMAIMDPGILGWIGSWGYYGSYAWILVAGWRAYQSRRMGCPFGTEVRILLLLVPTLLLVTQGLLRLTVLRYGYPLV